MDKRTYEIIVQLWAITVVLFIERFFGQKFEKSMRAFSINEFRFSCVYLQKDVTEGTSRLNNFSTIVEQKSNG